MAFTVFNTSDTLEQLRVKLNTLTTVDFGDPSTLTTAGISATSICGAMVELGTAVYSSVGFRIEDSSSSFQIVAPGEKLRVFGTSNQINAVVSATDLLTLSLTNNVTVSNNLTANGTLHTLGTIEISANTIRSTNTDTVNFNDNVAVTGTLSATALDTTTLNLLTNGTIIFEGSTADAFETTLTVVNPTADRIITVPNVTGTIITSGDTSTVTETMIGTNQVTNTKILNAAVTATKLASTVTLQILNSSGTAVKTLYGAGA
jgi:hypothetical protein